MNRNIKVPVLILTILQCIQITSAQVAVDWLKDYSAMKQAMAEAYANLDWAVNVKKLDIVALDRSTLDRLKAAKSDKEARAALDKFLSSFSDGHLRLAVAAAETSVSDNQPLVFSADTDAEKVCSSLGFKARAHRFSLPFENASGFKQVSSDRDQFPAAIFALDNGSKYGVLRIRLFDANAYPGNCYQAWNEYSTLLNKPCEGDCIDRFSASVENRLTRKLSEQIRQLQDERIDFLIVDIGGNGGGSDWVEAAARTISPRRLRSVRSGFIRHPHWVGILQSNLKDITEDLARKDLTAKQSDYLKTARAKVKQLIKEARDSCDRSSIWTTGKTPKGCDGLNSTPRFSTGIFDYLPKDEIVDLRSRSVLFMPSRLEYQESVFKGKLIVIVDGKTASASENFVSMMQLNKAGEVVNGSTYGAGCGYVNGGTNYVLPNSKLRLWMPDCVRYRGDGVNEVGGVAPDSLLWEENENAQERLNKLLAHLTKSN